MVYHFYFPFLCILQRLLFCTKSQKCGGSWRQSCSNCRQCTRQWQPLPWYDHRREHSETKYTCSVPAGTWWVRLISSKHHSDCLLLYKSMTTNPHLYIYSLFFFLILQDDDQTNSWETSTTVGCHFHPRQCFLFGLVPAETASVDTVVEPTHTHNLIHFLFQWTLLYHSYLDSFE